jgi:hypothetical protein
MEEPRQRIHVFARRAFWFLLATVAYGFIEANLHPGERLAVWVWNALVAWGQKPMGAFWTLLLVALLVGIAWAALDPIRQVREWRLTKTKKIREAVDAALAAEKERQTTNMAEIRKAMEHALEAEKRRLAEELAVEKVRVAGIMEVERVKEIWQWSEMNCCGIVVELLRDIGKMRTAAGDLTPGEWFGAADALQSNSNKLYNLLDKPNETIPRDVYEAFWSTVRSYNYGAMLVNRARLRTKPSIDPHLNRADEDRRLDRWQREHRRIARVNRCLRGRQNEPGQSIGIHADANRLRFESDSSLEFPNVAEEERARALEQAREEQRQIAGFVPPYIRPSPPPEPRISASSSTGDGT